MTAQGSTERGRQPNKRPPELRLVEATSEQMLRDLFDLEDDLINKLHRCQRTQKDVRQRYASERGLLMLPGMEKLRKVLGK